MNSVLLQLLLIHVKICLYLLQAEISFIDCFCFFVVLLLLFCGILYKTVRISDCRLWSRMAGEGKNQRMFEVLSRHLPGGSEEDHEPQPR
jgi:hypothetical protein